MLNTSHEVRDDEVYKVIILGEGERELSEEHSLN